MKQLNIISLALVLAVIVYIITKEVSSPPDRIGVVEMEKLVYDFQGMKDATVEYQKKMTNWNNQSDSLKQKLNNLYQEMQMDSINGDREKLKKNQQKFYYLQKSYYEYTQKINEKAKQDDQDMTIGILNQLKGFMADFSKENGYDIIIANTQVQNVGYVNKQNDITQELVEFSNKKYSGE